MTNVEPTADSTLLIVQDGEKSHAIEAGRGVATIGRNPEDRVQINDPRVALKVESIDGQWRVVDSSPYGMFVDGLRTSSVAVKGRTTVRLGDPTQGRPLTFEVVEPNRPNDQRRSSEPEDLDVTGTWQIDDLDPGVVAQARRLQRVAASSTSVNAALPPTGSSTRER